MNMFFYPALEFLIFIPGLAAAYLPMKHYLRMSLWQLLLRMLPLTLLLALICGGLCHIFSLRALWLFFPAAAVLGLFYVRTLDIIRWKSVSVFLAVCGSFSCLGGVANAVNAMISSNEASYFLSPRAVLLFHLMCWTAVLLAWYPSTHATRDLLEEEAFAPTWYVFWLLPAFFILLNLFLMSFPELFLRRRLLHMYIIVSLALLFLLILFYAMFYLMAEALNRNDRLRLENQLLSMQQARYDSLCTAIAETREARHDMRHHFRVLQGLAARRQWERLSDYLSRAASGIPDADLNLCGNTAADAVSAYYGLLYQKHRIPCSFQLDLPPVLPVPDMDLCLVLSNLMENALEAAKKTSPEKRQIRIQAYIRSDRMILITVENTFDGTVTEANGIFQSSKRRGEGIGLQSVRHIAEKNGGYCRFLHENGIFCANVMLRAEEP